MPPQRTDGGFSLVEVVVAMLLLGVLAIGILPLVISATQLSVQNKELAAANSFAAAQLAELKQEFPTNGGTGNLCSVLENFNAQQVPDPASTLHVAEIRVAPCPATYPATVDVSVAVLDPRGETLVNLSTRLLVNRYEP